jgi:hypothetical protein
VWLGRFVCSAMEVNAVVASFPDLTHMSHIISGWLDCISMVHRCEIRDESDGISLEERDFFGIAASDRAVSQWLTVVRSRISRVI